MACASRNFELAEGVDDVSFDVDEVISRMLRDYGLATVTGIAAVAGVTERTVRRHLAPLIAEGRVIAVGSTRDRRFVLPDEA